MENLISLWKTSLFTKQRPFEVIRFNSKVWNLSCDLTHLLYMDDIKLFAQNDTGLQKMVDLVRRFSDDIGMTFGINKCAKLTVKRGKDMSNW